MATYYEILGVGKDATLEELKKAYREQIALHRFDKGKDAAQTFDTIKEAFIVLADEEKRKAYDKSLEKKAAPPKAKTPPPQVEEVKEEVIIIPVEEELPIIEEELIEVAAPVPVVDVFEDTPEEEEKPKPKPLLYDDTVPEYKHKRKRAIWWIYPILAILVSAIVFLLFMKFDDSDNKVGDVETTVEPTENSLSYIIWSPNQSADGGYYIFSYGNDFYSVPQNELAGFLSDKENIKLLNKDERYRHLYNFFKKVDPLFDISLPDFTEMMANENYRSTIHEKIKGIDPNYNISFEQFNKGIASPDDDVMRYYVNTNTNKIEFLPEQYADQHDYYQPKGGEASAQQITGNIEPREEMAATPTPPEPKQAEPKTEEPKKEAPKETPKVKVPSRTNTGSTPYSNYYGSGMYSSGSANVISLVNRSNKDAVVILTDAKTGEHVRNVYVKAGDSFTVRDVPEGSYRTKTSYGSDWNPNLDNGARYPKGGFSNGSGYSSGSGTVSVGDRSQGRVELNSSNDRNIGRSEFFSK